MIFDIDYIATGLTANLRIGIYNGEIVFNILLGNGWSDLDDLFGRPPSNFKSDEVVKKISHLARLRLCAQIRSALRVVQMVLNTQYYQYLWLTM